jgi:hypothetical protein
MGKKGTLTMRLRTNKGFGGAQISLADRLFDPTDDQGEQLSNFKLAIGPGGHIAKKAKIIKNSWHEITFEWDVNKGVCMVKIDEYQPIPLYMANPTLNGISYLRLRSTARTVDQAGFYVEAVKVAVQS